MPKRYLALIPILLFSGCKSLFKHKSYLNNNKEYGVFLGASREDLSKIKKYKKVVIDAQYFEKEDIDKLKNNGQTVYSYLNVGSIENFRSYYEAYKDITLGEYEHWEEERWIDVSKKEWQDFLLNDLSTQLLNKGVDGFFIDNIDVYYEYQTTNIYQGIETILKGLKNKNIYVMVNGGDTFVEEYLNINHQLYCILDAVNQETVFSKIDWDKNSFSKNDDEERKYFQHYVETVKNMDRDVYLLEYTKDEKLAEEIYNYCGQHVFYYYISSTLELTV